MKKLTYLFLALLIVACSDDEGNPCVYNPTLTTSAVTNITETSATLNGVISIVSENCEDPTNTEQGFVYATTIQPTIANTQVNVNGADITTTLENLEPNTTYYVRTFLTNAFGEFYGNEVSFIISSRYKFLLSVTGNGTGSYCPQYQSDWYYFGDYTFDNNETINFQGEGFGEFTWFNVGENICADNLEINISILNEISFKGMILETSLTITNLDTNEEVINQNLDDLYNCDVSINNLSINFNPNDDSIIVITN